MRNLVDVIGLTPMLAAHGITEGLDNFEFLYDSLASRSDTNGLLHNLENAVRDYFTAMELPSDATIYDLLILSLREKDMIATFNWDPFLAQAFKRNKHLRRLPQT